MDKIKQMHYLYYPRSIALVGATDSVIKWGFATMHNILRSGYPGKFFPVNPTKGEILGHKVWKSIEDIPEEIDLGVIIIPAKSVPAAVEALAKKGMKACMVITSGFAEAGGSDEGVELQRQLVEVAEKYNVALAGPNGQGLACTNSKLVAMMGSSNPASGRISLVSQSGNLGASILGQMSFWGFGISKFTSSGNEAILKSSDYIRYFADDPDTDVIGAYIEGFGDGREFFEAARYASRRKPVVFLKGGISGAGNKAIASHTGAMASSTRVMNGALRQAGCVVAESLEEMMDYLKMFAGQPLPAGNRVGIGTIGGGWGVLMADACEKYGLDVIPLSPSIIAELDKFLPAYWSKNNPIDTAAERNIEVPVKVVRALLEWDEADSVVFLGNGYGGIGRFTIMSSPFFPNHGLQTIADYGVKIDAQSAAGFCELKRTHKKPLVMASDAAHYYQFVPGMQLDVLVKDGIATYQSPERAARALAALVRYAAFRRRIAK